MRMIEGLAAVRYDNDRAAVEVNFFGSGDMIDYQVAIQVALDVAAANNTNKWILIKRDFTDVNTGRFLSYVSQWMKPSPRNPSLHEVSIVVKVQAYRKMKEFLKYDHLYHSGWKAGERLKITLIESGEEAMKPSNANG